MLKKVNTKKMFWSFLIVSCIFVLLIKFSPLKNISTSQITYLSWFPFGFELGEVVYGISLSYIVSCIFYFVAVYLPDQRKRMKAMSIIENRIDVILGDINIVMAYYFQKHDIKVKDNENFKEEVEETTKIDFDRIMNFYYQIVPKSPGEKVPFTTGQYTEEMQLQETYNRIHKNVQGIFQIPVILNVDHNLIIALEEIDSSQFWQQGLTRKHLLKYFPQETVTNMKVKSPEFGKHLYSLYLLHQDLSKYITPSEYTFEQK